MIIGENSQQAGPSRVLQEQREQAAGSTQSSAFAFTVPWGALSTTLLQSLQKADDDREMADPKDTRDLKLAIAVKLVSAYRSFREVHPGTQKHPGRKVYQDITKQVFMVSKTFK